MIGINDRPKSSWNTFATVVVEGDSTSATDLHSRSYKINITNSKIEARVETEGNYQLAIMFNNPSTSNQVVVDGNSIVEYGPKQFASVS